MTITIAQQPTASADITDTVVLDGGLFFQPAPIIDQVRQHARDGVDVVVTLPLNALGDSRLRGVSRMLLEASVETRLRRALHAAGYREVTRRHDVPEVLVLDARA